MRSLCNRLTRPASRVGLEACITLIQLTVVFQNSWICASFGAESTSRKYAPSSAPRAYTINISGRSFAYPPTVGASSRRILQDSVGSGCIPPNCESGTVRVVGGHEVKPPNKYPFIVSLQQTGVLNQDHFCGGVVLDRRTILTAAHCVDFGYRPFVLVGRHDLNKPPDKDAGPIRKQVFRVSKSISHPNWNRQTYKNDLAILKLDTSISPSSKARMSVPLAQWPQSKTTNWFDDAYAHVPAGTRFMMVGWGTLKWQGSPSEVLQEAEVCVKPLAMCNARWSYNGKVLPGMFCAGGEGADSCQGDSGGPLVMIPPSKCQDRELSLCANSSSSIEEPLPSTCTDIDSEEPAPQAQLVGIISWGKDCADEAYPGVYVDVAAYSDFIGQHLDNQSQIEYITPPAATDPHPRPPSPFEGQKSDDSSSKPRAFMGKLDSTDVARGRGVIVQGNVTAECNPPGTSLHIKISYSITGKAASDLAYAVSPALAIWCHINSDCSALSTTQPLSSQSDYDPIHMDPDFTTGKQNMLAANVSRSSPDANAAAPARITVVMYMRWNLLPLACGNLEVEPSGGVHGSSKVLKTQTDRGPILLSGQLHTIEEVPGEYEKLTGLITLQGPSSNQLDLSLVLDIKQQYIHDLADAVNVESSFLEAALYPHNCSFIHRWGTTATINEEPFSIPVSTLLEHWSPSASYTHSWDVDLAKRVNIEDGVSVLISMHSSWRPSKAKIDDAAKGAPIACADITPT